MLDSGYAATLPSSLRPIATLGSLRGQAFCVDSASNGTVCVSSAEDKEP